MSNPAASLAWPRAIARIAIVGVFCGSSMIAAQAAQVEQIHVTNDGNAYVVDSTLSIDVPRDRAYRAATDFGRLPAFNPSIESSRRVGDDRLDSVMRLCVLLYCKRMRQVMRYTLTPDQRIDMQVVAGKGDLKSGSAHWQFAADGQTTDIHFAARIVPDFWIPPLVGPALIRRELRQQVQTTADAIEALARSDAGKTGSPTK